MEISCTYPNYGWVGTVTKTLNSKYLEIDSSVDTKGDIINKSSVFCLHYWTLQFNHKITADHPKQTKQ